MAFAAGFITCFVILLGIRFFFGGSDINSERLLRLQRDSADYVQDMADQKSKYRLIDSTYRYDMARLSFALDSTLRARAARPRPRINDADSLRRAILRELYQH